MFGTQLWKYAKEKLANKDNSSDNSNALFAALVVFNLFFLAYAFMPQLGMLSLTTLLPFLPSSAFAIISTISACIFYLSSELWATIFVDSVYNALLTDVYSKDTAKVKSGSFSLFQSVGNLIASATMSLVFARTTLLSTQLMLVSTSVGVISLLIAIVYFKSKGLFENRKTAEAS